MIRTNNITDWTGLERRIIRSMADQEPDEQNENSAKPAESSTADYEKFGQPERPIRNWSRLFTSLLILIVLAGSGYGVYSYLKNHKSSPPPSVQQNTQPKQPAAFAATTKSYNSPNLYLGFNYPADWTIVDNDGETLTATSPTLRMKDPSGQAVSGKIIMTIQKSATELSGFNKGNGVAVRASLPFTYTKPTKTQRTSSHATFVQYAATKAAGGLDAVYITGPNDYAENQAVPQADLLQESPIISLTFTDSNDKPLTIAASAWDDPAFSAPLLKLFESLSIT